LIMICLEMLECLRGK